MRVTFTDDKLAFWDEVRAFFPDKMAEDIAEKQRLVRLNFYAIHAGLLVIMVGALIHARFGFDVFVTIREGGGQVLQGAVAGAADDDLRAGLPGDGHGVRVVVHGQHGPGAQLGAGEGQDARHEGGGEQVRGPKPSTLHRFIDAQCRQQLGIDALVAPAHPPVKVGAGGAPAGADFRGLPAHRGLSHGGAVLRYRPTHDL